MSNDEHTLDAKRCEIYTGRMVESYDMSISHFFGRAKALAFADARLSVGDRVLVLCCGTGLDFAPLLEHVGPSGAIVGVDRSPGMLAKARERIRRRGWTNVELVEADVTRLPSGVGAGFDAGVCTLGMSIIPDYTAAYEALLASVRPGGRVVIGDMQIASGWRARLNPLTVLLAQRYGGSVEGHRNAVLLRERMARELEHVRTRELFFDSYFTCVGSIAR